MITSISIKNYCSIVDSTITLSPFTLLIGANGTGKTNFLRLLTDLGKLDKSAIEKKKHINYHNQNQEIVVINDKEEKICLVKEHFEPKHTQLAELKNVCVFNIDPGNIGKPEETAHSPKVSENGTGAVQVLDVLKTGDREELFDAIENNFKKYVPEIEKLSFVTTQKSKALQVREKCIKIPISVGNLSDGTRLALTILTILYQEHPPSLICLEEIDRGLHPRLFEKIIQLCLDLTRKENFPQIIATTHNPYLVDQFKDNEEAVIIVEKENGATTFTSLAERIKNLDTEEEPLGSLWYSGFVGGVPERR